MNPAKEERRPQKAGSLQAFAPTPLQPWQDLGAIEELSDGLLERHPGTVIFGEAKIK